MQIIEVSSFAVRSAFLRLEGGARAPTIALFPMVHVAEAAFYDGVMRRLEKCDLILYEGIKSRTVSILTRSYRSLAQSPRLGLVTQHTMRLGHLQDRLVHADVSGTDFKRRWSSIDLIDRGAMLVAALLAGFFFRYFATRKSIANYLRLDLLKSRDEILYSDAMKPFDDVIVTYRDQHLINVIEHHRQKHRDKSFSIAVVFGAGHMRALVHHLTRYPDPGYRIVHSEWMTVFSL